MNDYINFRFSNTFLKLINESRFTLFDDITFILNNMKSPIAKELLSIRGSEIKGAPNYLGIDSESDDPAAITFYNRERDLDWEVVSSAYIIDNPLLQAENGGGFLSSGANMNDRGKVIKVVDEPTKMAHFVKTDGSKFLFQMNGLRPIKTKNHQKSVIGRLSRRILSKVDKKFTQVEIDDFVNEFKALVENEKSSEDRMELVKGDEIQHWYLFSRYTDKTSGTLHSSCMRYEECQDFFGIYTDNSDVCQLLILRDDIDSEYIEARALVWKLHDGTTFMDRVYYSSPHIVDIFTNYAKERGWCYKSKQDSGNKTKIVFGDESEYDKILFVKLNDTYFDYYPYMDTLKCLLHGSGLYSDISSRDMWLESTNGNVCEDCDGRRDVECSDCEGDGEVECRECDGRGNINCSECDGEGEVECDRCDGHGELDCSQCDGGGEVECGECDGYGEVDDKECGSCYGSGNIKCDECDESGKVECSKCDGDATIKCRPCDGDGEEECEDCDGRGNVECYRCEGDGRVECDSCS